MILRIALYESDQIPGFRTNPENKLHYDSIPFTAEWVDEVIEIRTMADPYLMSKEAYLHLYVNCTRCSNALRETPRYESSKGSIMDRL